MPRLSHALSFALVACISTIGVLAGCNVSPSLQETRSEARKQFQLSEEPDNVQTALDLAETQGGFSEGPVTLVGVVGGMPNPWQEEPAFPWREGEATFFLVDPSTVAEFAGHEHAAGEDHSDCVFCRKRAANSVQSIAAVSFSDASGKPLTIGAQDLFGLKAGDVVVVKGTAKKFEDLLVVDAKGLYVRK